MPKFTRANAAAQGARGGRATVERHGPTHMTTIGARGFAATVERHWYGDRAAYTAYLRECGQLKIAALEERAFAQLMLDDPAYCQQVMALFERK